MQLIQLLLSLRPESECIMPTSTYVALATTTLGATAASVTFSSIPATYRDLLLVNAAQRVRSALVRCASSMEIV
jgi:hypothetical protein